MTPDPSGCAICGWDKRRHGISYTSGYGFHNWIAPDDALILSRMRERRESRKISK